MIKNFLKFASRGKVCFVDTVEEAIKPVKSGDLILLGGFGVCGMPEALCKALADRSDEVKDLDVACCTAGLEEVGPGLFAKKGMVNKIIASYIGECNNVIEMYWGGDIEVEFVPQGTLAEKMRAAGAGIPAFYTPTGVGTVIHEGGLIQKYNKNGEPEILSEEKELVTFNGRDYILEESLFADIGLIKGWKADKNGNIVCRGTALNFNPDCAKGAKITIAEVEEIVEVGELDPSEIQIQSIYVDYIVKPEPYEKTVEFATFRTPESNNDAEEETPKLTKEDMKDANSREQIARRVALEFTDGMYSNVGIGIPTLASNYLPEGIDVTLQSENGILGLGPFPLEENMDADFTNASKQTITLLDGASLFDSSESFAIIRGAHVDMSCLGGMQVSQCGDLSNWVIPGKMIKGMGGGMDLVSSGTRVVVCMEHNSKDGGAKILKENTLPLTGKAVVSRVITDIAVIDVEEGEMVLKEKAWWVDVEEVVERTEADLIISEDLKDIEYSL